MLSVCALMGCSMLAPAPPQLPMNFAVVRDELIVHSDFSLPARHWLFDELADLRPQLCNEIGLPEPAAPVHVYVFETAEEYESFLGVHFPEFPSRRAFFVRHNGELTVYTAWGPRAAEDLRHEVAHGYLHGLVAELPLWLDEGLAEFCEVPAARGAYHHRHAADLSDRMRRGLWQPDLARLESLSSAGDMTRLDYAEAYLWVHFLLRTTPERRAVLTGYLREIRAKRLPGRLSTWIERQEPDIADRLVDHLRELARIDGSFQPSLRKTIPSSTSVNPSRR